MDELHRTLFQHLMDDRWKHGIETAVDVTLLGRYYERFADHAVSVAKPRRLPGDRRLRRRDRPGGGRGRERRDGTGRGQVEAGSGQVTGGGLAVGPGGRAPDGEPGPRSGRTPGPASGPGVRGGAPGRCPVWVRPRVHVVCAPARP